jgi:cysteine desulfurase family protein
MLFAYPVTAGECIIMIYLDNAATSNPKPDTVADAVSYFVSQGAANPGRAGHPLANEAARLIFDTRVRLMRLLGAEDPAQLVFTANITESLNLVLKGLLKPGDEVIVSSMEHNAMMRPLRQMEEQGVQVTVVPCDPCSGVISVDDIASAISQATRLVAINHASNTFGTLQPLSDIGALCREHALLFLVDTAQTAGSIPIDMAASNIDFLAFTGHKGLLGPMGTGGLILSERAQAAGITPLITGGTGSLSELESQPDFLPDALESGTPNLPGIAGLNASVRWLEEQGIASVCAHEQRLTKMLIGGLTAIPRIRLFGPSADKPRVGVVAFIIEGFDNGEVDEQLAYDHGICCRTGLHCSPASHKTMGTFPDGTIRLSIGPFTTQAEIEQVIAVISQLAGGANDH